MTIRQVLVLLSAAAWCFGCSESEKPTCFPVHGQVVYRGQPLAEALVVFHPLPQGAGETPKPIAYTDPQGHYQLTTWQTHDGAPPGEYKITVELREARLVGEETIRDGRNLLPPQYGDWQQTPLHYMVAPGENEVPPLEISDRP